jgi:hypothetical protein
MGYGVADYNQDGTISDEEHQKYLASIGRNPDGTSQNPGNGFKTPFGTIRGNPLGESQSAQEKRANLNAQGAAASNFAGVGEQGYGAMTAEAQASRDYLRQLASGQHSVAGEQLRQGLQQNLSTQRSMAASASPQNQAMAARTAAMNMGRLGAGMSGAAAVAGLQERQQAQKALNDAILGARGQDMNVALGSRGNAISGYGGVAPDKSWLEKYGGAVAAGFGMAAK